jgi:Sulfotransferase domain
MLVGAPKAGTTSLYRYAAQHPKLTSHRQREMAFFFSDEEYPRGYDACAAKYFPDARDKQPGRTTPLAKHVFTMYSPAAVKRLEAHNPDIHVFALLRDPVQRAYSSYWYARRRGWESARTFEQAIAWEANRPADGWLPDRDRMHMRVGVYHPHVKRLLDTFGEDRVHVFLTDDLTADAARLCRVIFESAGVDPGFTPDLTRTHNPAAAARSEPVARAVAGLLKSRGPVKRALRRLIPHGLARRTRHALLRLNEKPFTPPPMNEQTRQRLAEHFAPHNEALSQLIGRDLSAWSRA